MSNRFRWEGDAGLGLLETLHVKQYLGTRAEAPLSTLAEVDVQSTHNFHV